MTIPEETHDQAVYHVILAEMHRLRAIMLNLSAAQDPATAESLREHFTREQSLTLGKLAEWRSHRPQIYREACEDFKNQVRTAAKSAESAPRPPRVQER
jgi:hypothetical protein